MLFSDFLQIIAVILEVAVMVIAAVIATRQKKSYGWCIAVTFLLFVLFDIGRLFSLPLPDAAHALIFLVACGSMLYGVWLIYEEKGVAD
jgi:bacteriorhodopsin